jgi:crossover junction endodeoxyribonuclease RuvC
MAVTVIGIDPGISGALAALDSGGNLVVEDFPTHAVRTSLGRARHELDLVQLARFIQDISAAVDHVFIERVNAMPGQGVTSMFRFGYAAGAVHGVIAALGLPFTFVPPQIWQRAQGVGAGADAARQRASQLFPQYAAELARKKDQHRADATLIARYGLTLLTQDNPARAA